MQYMGLCGYQFLWCSLLDIALYYIYLRKKLSDAEVHPDETSSYTSAETSHIVMWFCLIQGCLLGLWELQDSFKKELADGGQVQGNAAF